jgi:transposase
VAIVGAARAATGGVDTHLEVHVAAALNPVGALGTAPLPTTPRGYQALLGWLESFGPVARVGIEDTGSYGAGLSKFLARAGISVVEVNRRNRAERRRSGKSDPLDATETARAALGGTEGGDTPVRAVIGAATATALSPTGRHERRPGQGRWESMGRRLGMVY